METSIEKNDFQFLALQKTRLFPSGTVFTIAREAICISSTYQIAVASSGDNKLISFNSSVIHPLYVTKQTTNKEFIELQKKTVELAVEERIAGLSVNCDGTLLAVLVNSTSGAFVHIFDMATFSLKYSGDVYQVCSVRLGTEPTSKGVCLKWNPAHNDIFSASADDRTLIVAKVDPTNPTSYSLIGNKKMSAVVTHISWSPKGKQLTTGDGVGKVCQLKLELEVVRGTMPPELQNTPQGQPSPVIGLCWISTTEWLVAFPGPAADAFVFLLTLKKDQPVSWKPLPEFQYGNTASPVVPCFSFETSLLLSWNLVLLSSAKTSEISVVGKTNDWKVWNLDDEARLDLPTDSSTKETFPLGFCTDLSSSTQVYLNEERTKTHRASPILFTLTTDGVLTAHNIVSLDSNHSDCTIEPIDAPVASVRIGKRPPGMETFKPVLPTATATTSLFGTPSATSISTPAKSLFASSSPNTSVIGSSAQQGKGLFGSITTQTPAPTGEAKQFSASTVPKSLFQPQASSTPLKQEEPAQFTTNVTLPLPTSTTKPALNTSLNVSLVSKEEKEDLSVEVAAVNKVAAEVRQKWSSLVDVLRATSIGIGHSEKAVREAASEIPADGIRIPKEFEKMLLEVEVEYKSLETKIQDLVVTAGAKSAVIGKYESNEDRFRMLHDSESFHIDEKMKRLINRMDDVKEKFAKAKKSLENVSKMKRKAAKPPPPLSTSERDYILTQLKVVQNWTNTLTIRLDLIEEDMKVFRLRNSKSKKDCKIIRTAPEIKTVAYTKNDILHDVDFAKARERLILKLSEKVKQSPIKPKKIEPLPFVECTAEKLEESSVFDNFKETLLSTILKSPQKALNTSINIARCDASTQVDQPPQIKIIEKEVPVPQPMTPKTPQIVSNQLGNTFDQKSKTSVPVKPATPATVPTVLPNSISKPVESTKTIVTPTVTPVIPTTPSSNEKKPPLTAKPSLFGDAKTEKPMPSFGELSLGSDGIKTSTIFGSPETKVPVKEVVAFGTEGTGKVDPIETKAEKETKIPVKTEEKVNENQPAVTAIPTTTSETKPSFTFAEKPATTQNASSSTSPEASKFTFAPKPSTAETKAETPAKPSFVFSGGDKTGSSGTKSIFGGGAVFGGGQTAQTTTEKSSIFGGGTTSQSTETKSSIFGGSTQAAETKPSMFAGGTAATGTSSAFGGGAQPTEQKPFGTFGSPAKSTTFSFKPKEGTAPAQTAAPSFSFSQKPSSASSGFLAAAKAAVEEGMMEDESASGNSQSFSSGFGSFGSLSLGGSSTAAPSKGIFGGGISNQQQAQQQKSGFNMFNKSQQNNPNAFGTFGGAAAQAAGKPSIFGGAAQPAQSTGGGIFGGGSTFGQAAAQSASSSPSSAFNTAVPKFGAAASFGSAKQSVFGGKPVFQSNSSSFGSGSNPPAGGGFAKYASSGGSVFGSAQQQQQQNQNIFQFR